MDNVSVLSVRSRRDIIMKKIENVCLNLVRQLSRSSENLNNLKLRASDNEEHKQIVITRRLSKKFAYNMRCLAQIYQLISGDQHSTKRDLYYDHKYLYGSQNNLDRSITSICELLNESRLGLNVLSCSKGLLSGALCFLIGDNQLIDCRSQPVLVSESLTKYRLISEVNFILVVEKDATFQKLLDEGFSQHFPNSLLVTGKGYPDICTRNVLRWIVGQLSVPIYGLFDGDPHGIEILLTYKYGSVKERVEGKNANVKNICWIGLKPSDYVLFPVATDQFLPLVNRDYMKITWMRRRAELLGEQEIVKELDIMRIRRTKLEMEAISSIGQKFMLQDYIVPKLYNSSIFQ